MRFAKGHGTENDFVIIPDPDDELDLRPDQVVALCDRRAGIGGDGVLRIVRGAGSVHGPSAAGSGPGGPGADLGVAGSGEGPRGAGSGDEGSSGAVGLGDAGSGDAGSGAGGRGEWFMDYRNADGTIAEMCGNGIRVFARYLIETGLAEPGELHIATRAGLRTVSAGRDGDVTVDMGPAEVRGTAAAVVGGLEIKGLHVSTGNPHLACVVPGPISEFDLTRAPEVDPAIFPEGVNVEILTVIGPRRAEMRVHERGSGETRSCGTGAVASAVAAAHATGEPGGEWEINVPGGRLLVTLDAKTTHLTGPAVIVADGDVRLAE